MNPLALYIHIPFCLKKCFYCDFNSIPVGRLSGDTLIIEDEEVKSINRYIKALCREIEGCKVILGETDFSVESIYIGGGTPSLINADEIGNVLKICRTVFRVAEDAEVTIEANPGTVSSASLKDYLELGINRVSLGCQSFDNEELKRIGRVHKAEDIYRSFELAKKAGFKNINIDLIFGIPAGQNLESFASSLEQAISLQPQHISLYNLTIEESTYFKQLLKRGELELPDEEEQIAMYEYGINALKVKGFEHYEISSFALQGERCWHNVNYWRGGEYLGFGAGSHSFIKFGSSELGVGSWVGRRWWNLRDVEKYCEAVEMGNAIIIEDGEELEESKLLSEAMMLGLRMMEGIDTEDFYKKCGIIIEKRYAKEIEDLKKEGLLIFKDGRIRLTHKGLLFSNEVFLRFMT